MYLSALIFFALLLITLLSFKLSLQLNKSIQNRFSSCCCMILMIITSHTFLEFFMIRCWNNKLYFLLPLACMSLTVLFDSQIYHWVWIGSFFLVLSRLFEYLERVRKIFLTFAFSLTAIVYSWMVLYSSDITDREEGPFFANLGIVLAIDQALKVVISFFFSLWFLYSGKLQSLNDHCIGKFGINMLIEPQPRDESQANMCGAEIEVPEPIDKNKQELFPALPEPTLSPLASNDERKLSQISTNINSFEKKKQKKFLDDFDSKKKEKHFQAPDRTGHRKRKRNFLTIQEKLDENINIETIHLESKLRRDNWRHQRQQTHFQTPSNLKKRGRYSRNPSIQTTEALPQEFCMYDFSNQ